MKLVVVQTVFLLALAVVLSAGVPGVAQTSDDARRVFDLVNGERQKSGLSPLAWDNRLAAAARKHAELLAAHGELSHQFPDEPALRQRLAAVPLERSAENVGRGQAVDDTHEGFMLSPGHRGNILNPDYDAIGIGLVRRGHDLWITEDFAQRIPEVSDGEAAARAAQAFDRFRAEAGQAALSFRKDNRVQALACRMAREGQLNTARGLSLTDAHYAAAYVAMDPAALPPDVVKLRTVHNVSAYSIGACFARSDRYPSGAYWAVLVIFAR